VSSTPSPSRLTAARRRARFVKVASAGAAAVGFGILSVAVRGAHAGSGGGSAAATTGGSLGVSSRISQEAAQSSSFFGSGSVGSSASSSSPPQASTHTS
jgi:hypothetical protein